MAAKRLETLHQISLQGPAGVIPALLAIPGGVSGTNARRGLVVFFHGWNSCKEEVEQYIRWLGRAGFVAVAPDMLYHGQRRAPDFRDLFTPESFAASMFRVVRTGVSELSSIIDLVEGGGLARLPGIGGDSNQALEIDCARLGVAGISMGGHTAFMAAVFDDRVRAAAPLIGNPDWLTDTAPIAALPKPESEVLAEMEACDPLSHYQRFFDRALLIQNGGDDNIVPPAGSQKLHQCLEPIYAPKPQRLRLIVEPGVGRVVTGSMARNMVAWFEEFLHP